MVVDEEQARRIIDALSTTDYQAQHDNGHQKRGLLELNTAGALLA